MRKTFKTNLLQEENEPANKFNQPTQEIHSVPMANTFSKENRLSKTRTLPDLKRRSRGWSWSPTNSYFPPLFSWQLHAKLIGLWYLLRILEPCTGFLKELIRKQVMLSPGTTTAFMKSRVKIPGNLWGPLPEIVSSTLHGQGKPYHTSTKNILT